MTEHVHEVRLFPAFDDIVNGCAHERKGDHGRGTVKLVMASVKDRHAVSWETSTNWHLPETYEKGLTITGGAIDWGHRIHQGIGPGAVHFHLPNPMFEGHTAVQDDCEYTLGVCYFDVGYSISDTLEDLLLRKGDGAVWEWLDGAVDERIDGGFRVD